MRQNIDFVKIAIVFFLLCKMSDNEIDSIDLSEQNTQSQTQTQTQCSLSQLTPTSSSNEPIDPWGQLKIYLISQKRSGRILLNYDFKLIKSIDLVQEKTTIGRHCVEEFDVRGNLEGVSANHFTIIKNNTNDALSPVFLEDTSLNGTYISRNGSPTKRKYKFSLKCDPLDVKVRRYILAHKDVIFIQKKPSIAFEFHSFNLNVNDLPNEINKMYHVGCILGSGACGTVYLVQHRRTCEPYALKFTNDDENVHTFHREIELLRSLQKHPCIVKICDFNTYLGSIAIYLELMGGGDLLSRIKKTNYLSESLTKFLFYQICSAIEYLHSENVTHRDLKPENILLSTVDDYTLVKISDFGFSKRIRTNTQLATSCGTIIYSAPEVRTSNNYTNKVDIWSLGVILFNCLSGRFPFSMETYHTNPTKIMWQLVTRHNVSDAAMNVLRATIQVDANLRPSIVDLLKNKWLTIEDQHVKMAHELLTSNC